MGFISRRQRRCPCSSPRLDRRECSLGLLPSQSCRPATFPSSKTIETNYLHAVPKINKRMEPYLHFSTFFSRHLSIALRKVRLLLSIPKAKCALTENFQRFVLLPNGVLELGFTYHFFFISFVRDKGS
jgi:hypothetical protein